MTLPAQGTRVAADATLLVLAPPESKYVRIPQDATLAVRVGGHNVSNIITADATLIVYRTGIPDPARNRAWTFTLDGHTFYVLDLGAEGTWAYDIITKQWCSIYTTGFDKSWNMTHGVMWGDRIVGGDLFFETMYELDPNQTADEGWRPITHAVTGAISTRSRNSIGCAVLHLTGSSGIIQSDTAVNMSLRFSDDNGSNWSDYMTVEIDPGDTTLDISWPGLGSFSAPGRIFEITDQGGLIRIDGTDAGLNNFDDDATDAGS